MWFTFFYVADATCSFHVAAWLFLFDEMKFGRILSLITLWKWYLWVDFAGCNSWLSKLWWPTWNGSYRLWIDFFIIDGLNLLFLLYLLHHGWFVKYIFCSLVLKINKLCQRSKLFSNFEINGIDYIKNNIFFFGCNNTLLMCKFLLFHNWKWFKKFIVNFLYVWYFCTLSHRIINQFLEFDVCVFCFFILCA